MLKHWFFYLEIFKLLLFLLRIPEISTLQKELPKTNKKSKLKGVEAPSLSLLEYYLANANYFFLLLLKTTKNIPDTILFLSFTFLKKAFDNLNCEVMSFRLWPWESKILHIFGKSSYLWLYCLIAKLWC